MDEERDGAPQEIRFRLEISVEYCHVVAVFNVGAREAFFQGSGFVSSPVVPDFVFDVDPFARPSLALPLHHILLS